MISQQGNKEITLKKLFVYKERAIYSQNISDLLVLVENKFQNYLINFTHRCQCLDHVDAYAMRIFMC
jgi:hypothetical protein